jgi:biotin operon repressor
MPRGPAERLRDLAAILETVAVAVEEDRASRTHFDGVIANLRGLRRQVCGEARQPGSAKARIRAYLVDHVGKTVYGEELAEASGILAWARRVRELREEGLEVVELGQSRYRLERLPDD